MLAIVDASASEDTTQLVIERLTGPHKVPFETPCALGPGDRLVLKFLYNGRRLEHEYTTQQARLVVGLLHNGTEIIGVY